MQGSAAACMVRLTEDCASEMTEMRAVAAGHDAGVVGFAAQIEIGGRGGQADAAARAAGYRTGFRPGWRDRGKHPKRVAGAREAHRDRGVARADPPRNVQQAGLDFINGAAGGRQYIGLGGLGARQHLRWRGIQRDLLARAEAGEIDDADGVSVPVGDEAVAKEALGFGSGAAPRRQRRRAAARAARSGDGSLLLF